MITLVGNAWSVDQRGMENVFDGRATCVKGGCCMQDDGLIKFTGMGKKSEIKSSVGQPSFALILIHKNIGG